MELTSHVSPSHPTGVETVTFAFRTRDQLLQSLAARITDDRQGESPPRTPGDVDRWLRQRSEPAQQAILAEMDHVLSRVYISRQACEKALAHVVTSDTLALPSPGECWRKVNFRRIQDQGERQRVMLSLVEEALQKETGLTLTPCGSPDGPYVYLDDGVFTGTSVRWDIIAWVKTDPRPRWRRSPSSPWRTIGVASSTRSTRSQRKHGASTRTSPPRSGGVSGIWRIVRAAVRRMG